MKGLRYRDSLEIVGQEGYYDVNGDWVQNDDAPALTTIQCNIQPLRKRQDRENLPEGKRGRAAWIVYSDVEIKVADPLQDTAGTEAIIDGFRCEAVYSEKWRRQHLAHYKVLFVRKEVEANQ